MAPAALVRSNNRTLSSSAFRLSRYNSFVGAKVPARRNVSECVSASTMRRMKARIEKERIPRRVQPERHLKLGPGGLSDVEWTIQLLQQRHGTSRRVLRTTSTMEALDLLQDEDLISDREAGWLRDGYRFLSQVRNRLYLLRHRDVDVLPTSNLQLEVLSRSLGYPRGGWQQFEEDRRRHARHVRRACEQLFYDIEPTGPGNGW
jgi:[glutamine synthetase] adenylyltransferase / [glutamine synthetase]-adenylyl-L-tyrosine phosphorylase